MTGRASVWSDPRVIELASQFVPAADEVWRLQRGTDPECVFFQEMAEHGHYGDRPGSSKQGIYVVAPSGKFLASANTNRPQYILNMMHRGLRAWAALPAEERKLSPDASVAPRHRWESSFPERGLVLTCFVRDLPLSCDPAAPCEAKWNRDYAWFSAAEARRWLPETEIQVGQRHDVPAPLVARLARFHFVDAVKGQTWKFAEDHVKGKIVTEVKQREGARVKIDVTGWTQSDAPGRGRRETRHGVRTEIAGKATYDLDAEAFVEFELVALGERWGRTRFNGRYRDPESGPLGYVLRLAPRDAPRVAPAFIAAYAAEWVIRP